MPFGNVIIGLANFKGKEGQKQSTNMFTFGVGGGIKYFLSDAIGLRLQARLIFPMQFSGVGLGCGIGTGGGGCGECSINRAVSPICASTPFNAVIR